MLMTYGLELLVAHDIAPRLFGEQQAQQYSDVKMDLQPSYRVRSYAFENKAWVVEGVLTVCHFKRVCAQVRAAAEQADECSCQSQQRRLPTLQTALSTAVPIRTSADVCRGLRLGSPFCFGRWLACCRFYSSNTIPIFPAGVPGLGSWEARQ